MAEDLTVKQYWTFRGAFNRFDRNKDGLISAEEFGAMKRILGQNPTEAQLQGMIKEVDADEDGMIDFLQFLDLMVKEMTATDSAEEELMEAFKIFDQYGFLSPEELLQELITVQENLTDEEVVANMIGQLDLDGEGPDLVSFICAC